MNVPLNIDWQQILLHLFNFGILAGGLYLLLYAPVKKFMAAREARYEEMDRAAKEKLSSAEKTEQEYEQKLADAEEEIRKKKAQAAAEAEQAANAQLADAARQAGHILAQAKENAVQEHRRMIESAQREIADLALEASKKVLAQSENCYDSFLASSEGSEKHE
jgi:F-type H+-transporting ATPase subunit b